jgi:hypothetical protein
VDVTKARIMDAFSFSRVNLMAGTIGNGVQGLNGHGPVRGDSTLFACDAGSNRSGSSPSARSTQGRGDNCLNNNPKRPALEETCLRSDISERHLSRG